MTLSREKLPMERMEANQANMDPTIGTTIFQLLGIRFENPDSMKAKMS